MRRFVARLAERLPLDFRVLYRQFLLRVVDLEALSIEADIPRFLGQFAGVLILIGVFRTLGFLIAADSPTMNPAALQALAWWTEQSLLSMAMLVAGLIAVVSWDNIFPDRRDVMVLSPLPVRPRTILLARLVAAGAVLGIAIVALNFAMGLAGPLVLGGFRHFPRNAAAFWFAVTAGSVFFYGAVLTVQGLTAFLLPRRLFLRSSAVLQLAAFAYFLGNYFLEPGVGSPAELMTAARHGLLNGWPSFWFFALFNQLIGRLPPALEGLAARAWVGLGVVVCGAAASLLLCYLRTMKKIVEEPDLVPGSRGWHWAPRFGNALQTAVVLFSLRSLARSRQHRVVYAFFLAIAFAIAVSTLHNTVEAGGVRPLTPELLIESLVMMCLAVAGLRSISSLPVGLRANWMLQVTQLRPSAEYLAATRRAVLVMAVLPMWVLAAALGLCYRPLALVGEDLLVLGLAGSIMADLSLLGVSKIPFACSHLPGKSNIQFRFWAFVVVFFPIATEFAVYEQKAMGHPGAYAALLAGMAVAAATLWGINRHQSRSAVLYYEEEEPEVITTLRLGSLHAELQPSEALAAASTESGSESSSA